MGVGWSQGLVVVGLEGGRGENQSFGGLPGRHGMMNRVGFGNLISSHVVLKVNTICSWIP